MNDAQTFFQRILGDTDKIEMVYKEDQRSKKFQLASFSQDQKRETRRNPKILVTSQMDKMAPENVSNNSGTLKLDARREAQQAQFQVWSKYFNLKEVLHVKQRCSFSFSFKSKLSGFRAGHFNTTVLFRGWCFSLQRGYQRLQSQGYFCLLLHKLYK